MAVVLYPGAFKPPHRGHFELVKALLKGSAQARVYSAVMGGKTAAIDAKHLIRK